MRKKRIKTLFIYIRIRRYVHVVLEYTQLPYTALTMTHRHDTITNLNWVPISNFRCCWVIVRSAGIHVQC